jgi:hypothetical protein
MEHGMWDIQKSGSLKKVLKELAKYRLDLVGQMSQAVIREALTE